MQANVLFVIDKAYLSTNHSGILLMASDSS
jgi:hypothetical protein